MSNYIQLVFNFFLQSVNLIRKRSEFVKRNKTEFPSTSPYQFVADVAHHLYSARVNARKRLQDAMENNSTMHFPSSCFTGERMPKSSSDLLVQMLCEGGDLMACKGHSDSEDGTCHCFDRPEGKPLYSMIKEDGVEPLRMQLAMMRIPW